MLRVLLRLTHRHHRMGTNWTPVRALKTVSGASPLRSSRLEGDEPSIFTETAQHIVSKQN